jgi:hypothetical protein
MCQTSEFKILAIPSTTAAAALVKKAKAADIKAFVELNNIVKCCKPVTKEEAVVMNIINNGFLEARRIFI